MERGQLLFLAFAAVIVLYQVVKGWRLGLVRQVIRFSALAGAYITAIWGGPLTVVFLRPLGYPDFVLRILGGAGLGLAVYLLFCLIGGILFKRTAHQTVALVWFFYGITGALLGAIFGLVVTLFAADAIQLLGSLAQAGAAQPKTQTMFTAGLAEWKHSLDSGVPGEVWRTIDPVPRKVYSITGKIGQTVTDPTAVERFLSFPGSMQLATQPEIEALRDDPDILAALRDHRYQALLKNGKIIQAANSPKIAALIRQFDLEKALDHALTKPK